LLNAFFLYTKCSFLTTKSKSFSKFLAVTHRGEAAGWPKCGARPGQANLLRPEDQLIGKKAGEKAGICQFLSRLQAIKKGPL
jgi:hypothetical protein